MIEVARQMQEGNRCCRSPQFAKGMCIRSTIEVGVTRQDSRSRSRFGRGPLKYNSALEVTRYDLGKARERASFRRLALRAAGRSRVPVASGPPDSPSGRIGTSEREFSSSFWLLSMEYDTSEDIRRLKGTGGRKRHK